MDAEDKEEDYGLIRPSLIRQLRAILDQYPDDGHILKELIQNAEDAGARRVVFLYDEHSHPTAKLHHPDMAAFQGPALYAFNDAVFSEKDWRGIRMLQDSIKEHDPMKVGRFGLGFKSVLHMTDLPSVISSDRLYVIDPHEAYFHFQGDKTSGYSWNLREKKNELKRVADQVKPYVGLFGCTEEAIAEGQYLGTLFRFPLRKVPSRLSPVIYSHEKMEELFQSFERDAQNILLFLKHLEVIELQVRRAGEKAPRLVFKAEVAPSAVNSVRQNRLSFLDKLKQSPGSHDITTTYLLTINTSTVVEKEMKSRSATYIINEYLLGKMGASVKLQKLQADDSLSLVPLVGVAMEVKQRKEDGDEEFSEENQPCGQAFCFLPLPVEQKSATGLPVHVNGFFAVSQDRRHLKWPTAGQNIMADNSLMWNHCLLHEVVPLSYTELVKKGIELNKKNSAVIGPSFVYRMIPDIVQVDERWQIVLKPLFTRLFNAPVFNSSFNEGCWLKISDCVFDCLKEDKASREVIVKTLLAHGVKVVRVPPHVLHAVGAYTSQCPEVITPGFCRNILRQKNLRDVADEDKIILLQFMLKDEDFHDLTGLLLLPTADKGYREFSTRKPPVYLPTPDCPRELLPGYDEHLVSAQLPDEVVNKLWKMAAERSNQVVLLDKDAVRKALPQIIPKTWKGKPSVELEPEQEGQLPQDWLSHVWLYLRKHYPYNLNSFTGLPLLPLCSTFPMTLIPLSLDTRAMFQDAMGMSLPVGVANILEKMGVFVVRELPEFVMSHASVAGNYVNIPAPDDVLEVMFNAYRIEDKSEKFIEVIRTEIGPEEKDEMIEFLTKLQSSKLSAEHQTFLRALPLFRSTAFTEESPDFVSANEVPKAAPVHKLPVSIDTKFIDVSSENAKKIAGMLGVTYVSMSKLLKETVLAEFRQGKVNADRAEKTAVHIFTNFFKYTQTDPELVNVLSTVPFVVTEQGRVEKPCNLCDPDIPELAQLVAEQDVFPGGIYKEPSNLVILRKIGLKSTKSVSPLDILQSIFRVEEMSKSEGELTPAVDKATAILKFIAANPHFLYTDVNGRLLVEWGRDIQWIPTLQQKPSLIPSSFPLYSCGPLVKPSEVTSAEWLPLLSAVHPVLKFGVNKDIAQAFGWNIPPATSLLLQQLAKVVESYTADEKARFLAMLNSLYDELGKRETAEVLSNISDEMSWIWHGDGFSTVSHIVLKKPAIDMAPYLYSLPPEMACFAPFFVSCGMEEESNTECLVAMLSLINTQHKENTSGLDSQRDLQLAIDLLNLIAQAEITEMVRGNIIVPTHVEGSSQLTMLPVQDVTYCDVEWVRQGYDLMTFDQQDGVVFIHPNLPMGTAERLQVPTLMSRMLHAEELDITGFGQTEPLTDRLRKLLEDYTDGLAIPKELIQNADDAGARHFKLLYDERTNKDAMKFLIDENMQECQGPALWAYNDAVFSEKDFENITKLGGATKIDQEDKIGRFGLGFNAVYNVTDVPSFISGNNLVIFDPHTTHLGRGIKDKSKPGIKINLSRNRTLIRKLPHQFTPYNDVFGCVVPSDQEQAYYNGTLFRLPLRTKRQARLSEISPVHYDRYQVEELMQMLIRSAQTLLLFTQNIDKISVYHLSDGDRPQHAELVFETNRNLLHVFRPLATHQNSDTEQTNPLDRNTKFIETVAHFMKTKDPNEPLTVLPSNSLVMMVSMIFTGNDQLDLKPPQDSDTFWLVSSCMGVSSSMKIATNSSQHLLPIGGAALRLESISSGTFVPFDFNVLQKSGRAFCYLPLPVHTGLPFHINAPFAVHSNRRQLYEVTEDDKQMEKLYWNKALLEDAVVRAYIQLLHDLKSLLPQNKSVQLSNFWPSSRDCNAYFKPMLQRFYEEVVASMDIPLFRTETEIVTFGNTHFLHPNLAEDTEIEALITKAFELCHCEYRVITMPSGLMYSFIATGLIKSIEEKIYDQNRFLQEVFFPNIANLEASIRDPLVFYALQQTDTAICRLLVDVPCIPVSPDGSTLCRATDLVHPSSPAAKMFTPEDSKFPHGSLFQSHRSLQALQRLGMKVNDVSWDDIVTSAGNVASLMQKDPKLASHILQSIYGFIDKKILHHDKYIKASHSDFEQQQNVLNEYQNQIVATPFVKVVSKPDNFPISWVNDETNELHCPRDLMPTRLIYLVSATRLVADEEWMTPCVKAFLKLTMKEATLEEVVTQMEHALNVDPSTLKGPQFDEYQKIMNKIYGFLQNTCETDEETARQVATFLQDKKCILIDDRLFKADQVAFSFNCGHLDHLAGLSLDQRRKYKKLFQLLGVREQFDIDTYVKVLAQMKSDHGEKPLKERALTMAVKMVSQINDRMHAKDMSIDQVVKEHGDVYVPNTKGALQMSSSLCYNDCPWIKDSAAMNFTHPDITYNMSARLGVRTKRQEALSKHAKGIPFGQKEKLANSLKRVLSSYPCDHSVLKELVQNADDAKATEIHFVVDPRQHYSKQVFENSWKPLQGPALCVYNNSPFSADDLEGIQRLGEGSKSSDASKIGQYGIGFSSVYHLTDVPSLITRAPTTGETLCVFDPMCLYVPGATAAEPGIRYEDVPTLRGAFPDVFGCYNEKFFDMSSATMFRFPLRDRIMAEKSEISKNQMTLLKLRSMLSDLQNEAFDVLLFTNHIEQLSISEVSRETGKLSNTLTFRALISESDRKERVEMNEKARNIALKLKSGECAIADTPVTEVDYSLFMTDNTGRQEKWCVAQRIGFEKGTILPEEIEEAFSNSSLCLSPRGGTACLLEKRLHNSPVLSNAKSGKAFCFMPLPVETDLPVQINGHFALDHENRRHLWPEAGRVGFKKLWNDLLCCKVLAPAYVNLLKTIRMKALPVTELSDNKATVVCPRSMLDSCIKAHQSFFPSVAEGSEWNVLSEAVYRLMVEQHAPLLPSIKDLMEFKHHSDGVISSTLQISWLPPCGEGTNKAFFSKPEESKQPAPSQSSLFGKVKNMFRSTPRSLEKTDGQILKEVLAECGFKLLEANSTITESLENLAAPLDFMSPSGVMVFFQSYASDNPACSIGPLPMPISQSPFHDENTLRIVMRYCSKDPQFSQKLDGLPMLLTVDNQLKKFDAEEPAYHSDYQELLPQSSHCFIKNEMAKEMFNWVNKEECSALRPLDIEGFAELLDKTLPVDQFCTGNERVEWNQESLREPWVRKFWMFVGTKLDTNLDLSSTNRQMVRNLALETMSALHEWNLLPAKCGPRRVLYKVNMGKKLVLFSNTDYKNTNLRKSLRKLMLPELDVGCLRVTGNTDAAALLVTTLENPVEILNLVDQAGKENPDVLSKFDRTECIGLLKYFSDNITLLEADDRESEVEQTLGEVKEDIGSDEEKTNPKVLTAEQLRQLPFYTTIFGEPISLVNCLVYTLPAKIPTNGIDVWQSKSGTVFLERNDSLQPLYDFLGCASISILEVYCKFIFQHFEYFSPEDRLLHLHHVYSTYIKNTQAMPAISEDEREMMLDTLKDVPIIEDADGDLLPVNQFYDPENTLFRALLPEDKFPPRAPNYFRESDWHALLGKLGLIKEVSREQFMEFTQQVAFEGRDCTSASALTKSKMLMQHLYKMPRHLRDDILPDIADVAFISPQAASPDLVTIYPQHGDLGNDKLAYAKFRESVSNKYQKLVWSQASLLPEWADPNLQHNLSPDDRKQVQLLLQQKEPSVEVVLSHLMNLIHMVTDSKVLHSNAVTLKGVFKELYRFFESNALDCKEIIDRLKVSRCILVKDGTDVITPTQAVLNMFETDEIHPHLFRVPMEFGEFQTFFQKIGVSQRVTPNHYGRVLQNLKKLAGPYQLIPSEMAMCLKALKGFFESLEVSSSRDITIDSLYLPSEAGILVDATRLVFNDAPSFYDRAQKCGLQFVFDLRDCGYRCQNTEDILQILPPKVCPGMLSVFVKEHLVDTIKKSVTTSGNAGLLGERIKSEEFGCAAARLIRHEAHRRDHRLDEQSMFNMLDRLSTIHIYGVDQVATYLTFRDKTITGSEAEKACFVEVVRGVETNWNVFIKNDAAMGEDLLIPLADVINSILGGMLHNSVLYLLPILSCAQSDIQSKLNNLNIRLDQSQGSKKSSVLPCSGEPIHKGQEKYLVKASNFLQGECVAYMQQDMYVYATIEEEVMSPDDHQVYLISLAKDTAIAKVSELRKFERN